MAKQNRIKSSLKRGVKKSLVAGRQGLRKNKKVKGLGVAVRDILFPLTAPALYNFSRYAPSIADYQKQLQEWPKFKHKPLISIVMPTYNTPGDYLRECIESVLIQSYANWELCIADDASTDEEVVRVIEEYQKAESRVRLVKREENGHISAATNSAIDIANGEFVALLDHDDILWPNALFEMVKTINEYPDVDFMYSDEDKLDADSEIHSYPFLKPDWSPEFLESCNYITHFSCLRTSLVKKVGGFRIGYEGAQDWDLFMRISEKTNKIVHVSKILYSWRIHEASTAKDTDAKPYVFEAQRKLLVDHIERTGQKGIVKQGVIKQHCSIEYEVKDRPLVSIILYGQHKELRRCLESILKHSSYKKVEIIITGPVPKNGRLNRYLTKLGKRLSLQRAGLNGSNVAANCNEAAKIAKGEYLTFIDSSMLVCTKRWLELLLSDAQRSDIGASGGKTISQTRDRFMRAGIGVGIYALYAPLLEYMPLEDVHYMRGLYGQSRRNVSAVDSGCLIVRKKVFEHAGGFSEDLDDMFVVDLCLKLLQQGKRIVYNPFIATSDTYNMTAGDLDQKRDKQAIKTFQAKWQTYIDNDPFFNADFSRTDAQMGLK